MVPEAARVHRGGHERVAQRVHHHQWGRARRVAEVVLTRAGGQAGAGGRLHGDGPQGLPGAGELVTQEREHEPAEMAAAAVARDEDVRVVAGQFELFLRLVADDRLVEQDVVEHAAERVAHGMGSRGPSAPTGRGEVTERP